MSASESQRRSDPFRQAKANMEIVGNSIYYAMAMSGHMMKLSDPTIPDVITLDDLLEIDFIIGNLLAADVIMQRAQQISA